MPLLASISPPVDTGELTSRLTWWASSCHGEPGERGVNRIPGQWHHCSQHRNRLIPSLLLLLLSHAASTETRNVSLYSKSRCVVCLCVCLKRLKLLPLHRRVWLQISFVSNVSLASLPLILFAWTFCCCSPLTEEHRINEENGSERIDECQQRGLERKWHHFNCLTQYKAIKLYVLAVCNYEASTSS